jgi:hypothetical protein
MNGTINFGSGRLFLLDGTNAREVGVLKDVSVDFSSSQKELRGSRQYALAIATSGQTITGKAASGVFSGALISSILGLTTAAGSKRTISESKTHTAGSATVTPPNSGTFYKDLGVEDASGIPMTYNSGTPAVGEYKNVAGVYTFNASQVSPVTISYAYTLAALGYTATINNNVQAAPTSYQLLLSEDYGSKTFGINLFNVVIPKVSMGVKAEDFTETSIEFSAISNATNSVGEIFFEK